MDGDEGMAREASPGDTTLAVAHAARRCLQLAVPRFALVAATLASVAALAPAPLGAQQGQPTVRARISGVVFDSLASRPLAGALVQLVPAQEATRAWSAHTGANGAFSFDSVEAGTYLLGFYHALLDSLGVTPPLSRIEVRAGRDVRVPLAIPSGPTLRVAFCGRRALTDTLGLLIGYVRSATDGMPRARSSVRVQWSELVIGADGIRRMTPMVGGETSEQGGVAVCGLPVGGSVLVRAWNGSDSSGFAELEVPSTGLLRRDLFVGPVRTEMVRDPIADSTGADSSGAVSTVWRGSAMVRGVVRRPDGAALAGARLTVFGTGIEDTTTSLGTYGMRSLPPGTHTLEVRALGHLPIRRPVDIMEGGETVVDLRLDALGVVLDTIRVRARAVYESRERREIEQRRRQGFGTFMDEEFIEKRQPFYVADLFRMTPGVRLVRGTFGERILMRGMGFSEFCYPTVYVDGMRVMNIDGDLDAVVNVSSIRFVEVYPRAGMVPAQFQAFEGCGSVVIWTGPRSIRPTLPTR